MDVDSSHMSSRYILIAETGRDVLLKETFVYRRTRRRKTKRTNGKID